MNNIIFGILLTLSSIGMTKHSITGTASYYHDKFHGRKTATGEIFSQHKFTAASNFVKLGTMVRVTNIKNNKTVDVKINDRMAPSMARKGRVIDLSKIAAKQIGNTGLINVRVEML